MMKLKGSWGEINGARWCSGLRARHSWEFCKSTMLTKQTYKLFNQRDNAIWLDGIHFPPPSPSLTLSGLPLPGFLWCGGQNGETTGTICQMCVSHTKLPLCHLGFFSTRNCLESVRALQYWNFLEKHSDKSSLIITKCPQTQTFEILLPATVSPTKA